ncbi:hypothetical protein PVAND_007424 [Polypedilum vanderplanki]|uniref:Uncharacterized protein n=1 Tax=Polypedilum vanderplanki TaxID=319348 RepID=A0A9J6C6H2_POLVA|nr:hypothetical protein PVAND_007424 [Polypedilum vanderplanki]
MGEIHNNHAIEALQAVIHVDEKRYCILARGVCNKKNDIFSIDLSSNFVQIFPYRPILVYPSCSRDLYLPLAFRKRLCQVSLYTDRVYIHDYMYAYVDEAFDYCEVIILCCSEKIHFTHRELRTFNLFDMNRLIHNYMNTSSTSTITNPSLREAEEEEIHEERLDEMREE